MEPRRRAHVRLEPGPSIRENINTIIARDYPASYEAIGREWFQNDRWEGEIDDTRRNGSHVVVSSRWVLERDDSARPARIIETANDITAHKKAEGKRARLARAVEAIKEGIGIISSKGKIEYANPAFCTMIGYSCEEILDKSVDVLREVPGAESFYNALTNTKDSGKSS